MAGWTWALVLLTLGFLGNIEFSHSIRLSLTWIFIIGSILGIIGGAIFSLIAGPLIGLVPSLRRNIHPLALVRAGFMLAVFSPLFSLLTWPAAPVMVWTGPVLAAILAWMSIKTNPHAELVPHSSMGRAIGTAVGPMLIMAVLLSIIVPMYNRGLGPPMPPRLVFLALDGADGETMRQLIGLQESGRYPEMAKIKAEGGLGTVNPTEPLIPAKLWADTMTGVDPNGIIDSFSPSEDLSGVPIWQVMGSKNWRVGLFQMLPQHPVFDGVVFDIPAPGDPRAGDDPRAVTLSEFRTIGSHGLPPIWGMPYLALRLARLGVKLSTIQDLAKEAAWEIVDRPSPRLVYAKRKLLEFQVEADVALSLMRGFRTDAVFLRFPGLSELFLDYWGYSNAQQVGPPPPDVDAALMAGLARVLPDAAVKIDRLVASLAPYRKNTTVLCMMSPYGERGIPSHRGQGYRLSADRILEINGLTGEIVGEPCGDALCLREADIPETDEPIQNPVLSGNIDETFIGPPAPPHDPLRELEYQLRSATWIAPENPQSPRTLFTVARHGDGIEFSIQPTGDLQPNSIVTMVTMGSWTGTLSDLLESDEPRSATRSGPGFFAIVGAPFRAGGYTNSPTLLDIMPTLLRAFGLPVSRELQGRAVEDLFGSQWLQMNPASYVDEYLLEPQPEIEPPASVFNAEPINISPVQAEPFNPEDSKSGLAGSRI
jgi:hypothetical protein